MKEIESDVTDLLENRFVFEKVTSLIKSNPEINKDNILWDYLKLNYGSAMVLGIARQVDTKRSSVALLRILGEIKKSHQVITEKWFAKQYVNTVMGSDFGAKEFKENFGREGFLDEKIVDDDIKSFKNQTVDILNFRHTRIAHKNKDKTLAFDLPFSKVNSALDLLEKIVIKYNLLLNQVGIEKLLPVMTYDWEEVFRVPWEIKIHD